MDMPGREVCDKADKRMHEVASSLREGVASRREAADHTVKRASRSDIAEFSLHPHAERERERHGESTKRRARVDEATHLHVVCLLGCL
jgi:hypothetical protein